MLYNGNFLNFNYIIFINVYRLIYLIDMYIYEHFKNTYCQKLKMFNSIIISILAEETNWITSQISIIV